MAENRVVITADAEQAVQEYHRLRAESTGSLSSMAAAGDQVVTRTGVSAAQTAAALRQVPAQLTDIVVGLQAGQAPLTVLLQQGGQLKDMFGGAGAAARALGGYVVGLVNPFSVAAVVVGGLAVAHKIGAEEAVGYSRSIILSGNAAGTSANQMADYARNIGKVTGSQHEAAGAITALTATGQVSVENLQRFSTLAIEVQHVVGRAVADTSNEFSELGKTPLAALEKINDKYHFITAATYAQVKALEDQGRAAEAANVAQLAYADGITTQKEKVEAVLTDWERGWLRIKKAASGAADDVINLALGRQATNTQKITAALTERELIEQRIAVAVKKGDTVKEASFRADLANNATYINGLRAKQDAEKGAAKAEADGVQTATAKNKWLKDNDQFLSRQAQLQRDITAARNEGAAAKVSPGEIEGRIAEIRKKYSDIYNDGIDSQIEAIKRRGTVEDSVAQRSLALLASNHAAGLVNDRAYIDAGEQLDLAAFDRKKVRLQQELALTAGKSNSLKDQAAIRGQIDDLDVEKTNRKLKSQNDLNELEVKESRQAAANFANIADQQSAARQRLEQDVVAQRDYNDQIGLTKDGVMNLAAARLEERAKLADENALIAEGVDFSGALTKQYQDQATALRALAAEKRAGAAKEVISERFSPKDLQDLMDPTKAKSFGDTLKDAFNGAGDSITKLRTTLQDYANDQITIDRARAAALVAYGNDSTKLAAANIAISEREVQGRVNAYGNMAGAAKGFFKENSVGYKVMQDAEKAFRAYELLLSAETMAKKIFFKEGEVAANVALNATKLTGEAATTGASVALAGTESSAWGVTAVVKALASLPFPLNLAAGAVTLAAVLAIGAKVTGGMGGGSVDVSKKRQDLAGTGSVLGDESAKSESIGKSIENLEKYASINLSHTQGMLTALVAIRDNIGTVAALASQTAGLRATPIDEQKFGVGSSSGFLGIGASSTTIQDSGIKLNGGQTVGSAIAGGVDARGYVDVQKKNSGLWGLFSSSSTSRTDITLDDDLKKQFGLLLDSMRTGTLEAVKMLGVSSAGILDKVNQLALGIDEISFKGLTGDQIEKELEAVFSKVGDDIAKTAVPELAQFQKVGEGYLQTLTRVATDYSTLDSIMAASGRTFGAVGLSSIDARERLIRLSGGLDNLASNAQSFQENYLSEAERLAPIKQYVTEQLDSMGLSAIDSREKFKSLALSIDVTTEAGAKEFAALMSLEGAFAKTHSATVDLTKSEQDIADERKDLQKQYDQLTLSSVQLAEKARNAIAPYNLALYDQVQAVQAAKDAEQTAANDRKSVLEVQAQIYAITGDAAGAAAVLQQQHIAALKDMTPTLAAANQELWATQAAAAAIAKAKEAATASKNAITGFGNALADSITKAHEAAAAFRALNDSLLIGESSTLSPEQKYAEAKRQFETADADKLQSAEKAFLDASKAWFGGSVGYATDFAAVLARNSKMAASQDATAAAIPGIWKKLVDGGFMGAHENGGVASGWSLVGERGPEVVNFTQPGRVYTASQSREMMGGTTSMSETNRLLQEVLTELRADKTQRGAVADATLTKLGTVLDKLDDTKRAVSRALV